MPNTHWQECEKSNTKVQAIEILCEGYLKQTYVLIKEDNQDAIVYYIFINNFIQMK